MNDSDVQNLLELLRRRCYQPDIGVLSWVPDDDTARQIVNITNRTDELGMCANFRNGEYVALDNCELKDFALIVRLDQPKMIQEARIA